MARRFTTRLASDRQGSMAIETAIIAPVLALMSLGAFDVSGMVARQSELQSAAAEATAIVLAIHPTTDAQLASIEDIIEASAGLSEDQVSVVHRYRCGTETTYVNASASCDEDEEVATYLRIHMTATYTPRWTAFGVGEPLQYDITRTVQVS